MKKFLNKKHWQNTNQEKAGVATLISGNLNFRVRNTSRKEEEPFIISRGQFIKTYSKHTCTS